MTCTNHLKQIGLALHNHHDSKKQFPAGTQAIGATNQNPTDPGQPWFNSDGRFWWSPRVLLFPYVEQAAAWDRLQSFHSAGSPLGAWSAAATSVLTGPFSAFLCPSDGQARAGGGGYSMDYNGTRYTSASNSFRYNTGDGLWNNNEPYEGPGNPDLRSRGMFSAIHPKDMAAARDGTSNTLGFTERAISSQTNGGFMGDTALPAGTDFNVRSGLTNSPNWFGNGIKPEVCMNNARSTADRNVLAQAVATWGGQLFADGRVYNDGITPVLPPNAPSCVRSFGQRNGYPGGFGHGIFTASSYHTGGVNGVFMDGSVHFISDTINTGDLSLTQGGTGVDPYTIGNTGKSNYGVWGAIGTPQGGESVSL